MMNPAIIVPYRDRQAHLDQFVPAMRTFLPQATIIIVEQADIGPFNRAKLINIGVQVFKPDWFVTHDVDKIPLRAAYRRPHDGIIHQMVNNRYQLQNYLGGVTAFNYSTFHQLGGYSNHFWGWGGEDNEMAFRARARGVRIINLIGTYEDLPHPRPPQEFDRAKWEQAKRPRAKGDNYLCRNYMTAHLNMDGNLYHLKVDLLPPL